MLHLLYRLYTTNTNKQTAAVQASIFLGGHQAHARATLHHACQGQGLKLWSMISPLAVCTPMRQIASAPAAAALQVCQVKELDHWMLYLVDWGYNTKQEREQASSNPRIQVVNHQQLSQAITG